MKNKILSFLLACTVVGTPLTAATYYSDPKNGKDSNPGTESAPWPGLEEIASSGLLNELVGGDTLLLQSGYHGKPKFSGDHDSPVIIDAAKDAKPQLGTLTIPSGSNWTIRNLAISPSFFEEPFRGNIVILGENGQSNNLVIENCHIFSTEDTSNWGVMEWRKAPEGILLGRHGSNLTARNNYLENLRFGITVNSPDSLLEGNVVSDFSGDGIRLTRDNITAAYNVIKNVYVSAADGDKNHDDAIQCFLFNEGTGTVRNLNVHHNLINMRENPDQPFPATFHGIGFFDGPLVGFKVEDNVVALANWHGVSLYDGQDSLIANNVVYNPWGGKFTPWIMLGTKKNEAHGNTMRDNFAEEFKFEGNKDAERSGNEKIDPVIYEERAEKLLNEINEKFGETHPVSGKTRVKK
ncbi:MAG: right-handed parallel beta-helix repeat-containing protein [Chthoniobacterales bacterium]